MYDILRAAAENGRVSVREDYQELIDEVSALLGAPATLEARDFALIAFGAHDSDDDRVMDPVRTRSILHRRSTPAVRRWFESFGISRATGPVRIPPEPSAGVVAGRICLPVRHGGVTYGYIWLLDDGKIELSDPRLATAEELAARTGALLAEQSRAGARLLELLRTLLTAAPAAVPAAAAELAGAARRVGAASTPAQPAPLAMVAVTPWPPDAPASRTIAALTPGPLVAAPLPLGADTALAALVRLRGDGDRGPADALAERLAATGPGTVAGVGGASADYEGLPASWRQAGDAARAARAEPRLGPVAHWDELGPYRLLTALPPAPPDRALTTLLAPAHRELAHTAECYLDHAGQAGRTAAALGIHRQTLYYRLSRVEQLTGLDLAEGADRLLLHMALKAARL